jgi:hypothetical protein
MLLTILYTLAMSSLLQLGENNRYRFPLDTYFLVMGALMVKGWWERRQGRRGLHSEKISSIHPG